MIINLNPSPHSPIENYSACAANTADSALRTRLLNSSSEVVASAADYDHASAQREWFLLPSSIQPLAAEDAEIRDLYRRAMSRLRGAGRPTYDDIFNSSPNGICPMCGQGKVSTLDHYLPKSRYAHFAILPHNLIPCCIDCNFAKGESYPSSAAQQTFHPYFDHLDQCRWLFCEVVLDGGVSLSFYVDAPDHWSELQFARARNHV